MKQLAEIIPLVLFFITYQMNGNVVKIGEWQYQFDGIFSATAILIIATVSQVVITRLVTGYLEKRLLWLLAAVCIFGGATLVFRDQTFIQWKPTIFNWVLAILFIGSHFFSEKNLMERTLSAQITLPKSVWSKLNLLWIINFTVVGGLNLYVAYNFSESTWVSYKLYSAVGFTLLVAVLTAVMVAPHLDEDTLKN
jgi:intracellular septation protein